MSDGRSDGGGALPLADSVRDTIVHILRSNLGNSSALNEDGATQHPLAGEVIPQIPRGVPTTMIPVPFPVTTPSPGMHRKIVEELAVLCTLIIAGVVWSLPWFCVSRRLCCRCFKRWVSRRLGFCFFLGLLANVTLVSVVVGSLPDVTANDLFFAAVDIVGAVSDKMEKLLKQAAMLGGVAALYLFRRKIFALLGFDHQLVRGDLKDVLTCFSMSRFRTIELAVWKVEDLPAAFQSRSLFLRIVLGYNEPQHTRPHPRCKTSMPVRERFHLNYDPEDDTQKLSIMVKQQEVVGGAVSSFAPAAGFAIGGIMNIFTPLGPTAGAGAGVVAGVGAANSLGVEVARVDLSSAMVNRLRKTDAAGAADGSAHGEALSTGPAVPWAEGHYTKVDLVPHGHCWLRISSVDGP